MHYLKNFNVKNLKYDLINKFFYTDIKKLPKIKKIILNFGCKTTNIKILATNLLALELITNKRGSLRTAKHLNLTFKIKKGNPTGCILTLNKDSMLDFISKILTETFTKIKQFGGLKIKCDKNCLSYTIKNSFNFNCLENHYHLFNNLSNLNVTIVTNSSKKEETLFVLKSLQLPFLTSKYNSMVECNLAKIEAEGSNPFICSKIKYKDKLLSWSKAVVLKTIVLF